MSSKGDTASAPNVDPRRWFNDGTSQDQRFPAPLDPLHFRIDGRSIADFLAVASAMAANREIDDGRTWAGLFPPLPEGSENAGKYWKEQLAAIGSRTDNPPHLALFLTFLQLSRHVRRDLNALGKAHLDYYYRQVLGFRPRPAEPDHVAVFFSLADGVRDHRLPAGTELAAGEDANGLPLVIATDSEIVVNRAQIERLMTLSVIRSGKPPAIERMRASPAADSLDGRGAPFPEGHPGTWAAFGERSETGKVDSFPIGFAITSPLLVLGEGWREITLKFSSLQKKGLWFQIALSGEKGWLEKAKQTWVTFEGDTVLTFTVTREEPAIVRHDSAVHGGGMDTEWPVLKIFPSSPEAAAALSGIKMADVGLSVMVDRIGNLELSGDLGPLSAGGGSFQPFGPQPAIGSGFSISSAEIEVKRQFVTQLTLPALDWLGRPNLASHYKGYDGFPEGGDRKLFKATLAGTDFGLFQGETSLLFSKPPQYPYQCNLTAPDGTFSAFGHSQYPALLSRVVAENAAEVARVGKDGGEPKIKALPAEPFTPTLKSFTLGYTAELDQSDNDGKALTFFHLHPFGVEPVTLVDSAFLLPDYPDEGYLYIGLADLKPRQVVHLHFAAIEGSGQSPGAGEALPEITWSRLIADGWRKIGRPDIEDETRSLLQPGIISFSVGDDAIRENPLMPPGLHWIRGAVSENSAAACKLAGVRAQAVRATVRIDDPENPPAHLRKGERLPPGKVTGLASEESAIAGVDQPRASFGGRAAEDEIRFYNRVSERLRHRNRALTPWDYERLVLEAFPEIYKVMCVRAQADSTDGAPGPGEVTIVVIPRSAGVPWIDPLQPRMRPVTRERIREFLAVRTSAMVEVKVIDPAYEALTVSCRVMFRPGKSERVYRRRLNEDLKRFFSPWAYDAGEDVIFGGRLHRSVIETFIETRPYVDHFTNFELKQQGESVVEAKATHPWSVLVSAKKHGLTAADRMTAFPNT